MSVSEFSSITERMRLIIVREPTMLSVLENRMFSCCMGSKAGETYFFDSVIL